MQILIGLGICVFILFLLLIFMRNATRRMYLPPTPKKYSPIGQGNFDTSKEPWRNTVDNKKYLQN